MKQQNNSSYNSNNYIINDSTTVCGRYLRYPDTTGKRKIEGGVRLHGEYKKSSPANPLVTVVTTVFNCEKYIEEAMNSVFEQTYCNIEYIVIDAASDDKTVDIIRQYQDSIDYYISEPDCGIYSGMNKGISLSTGDYIIILNADDYYKEDAIEKLVQEAVRSNADIVAAHAEFIKETGELLRREESTLDDKIFLRCTLRHETMLVRKKLYDQIGYYDESKKICADWFWIIKAYKMRKIISIINEYLLVFRATGASAQGLHIHDQEKIEYLQRLIPDFEAEDIDKLRYPHHLFDNDINFLLRKYQRGAEFIRAMTLFLKDQPEANNFTGVQESKRLKFVFVVWGLALKIGGLERVGVELANEMTRRGHESVIMFFDYGKPIDAFLLEKKVSLLPFYVVDTFESRNSLKQCLLAESPDVCVPMFSWHDLLWWPVALKGTGIPMLISEHNDPNIIEIERWNRIERLACMAAADTIHLLCESYKNSLPTHMQHKVTVIPNTTKLARRLSSPRGKKEDTKKLLAIGHLEQHKQHTILIEAFSLLSKKAPEWDLDIWGEGSLANKLKEKIKNLGIEKKVRICGTTNRIEKEYENAHLVCMPSRNEGFGMVVLEAMCHGLPVIGFGKCSGVNEIILHGKNGLLVPEMNAESLAEKLLILMQDDELREQMGKKALKSTERFSQEIIYDRWEQLLIETAKFKNCTQLDNDTDNIVLSEICIHGKRGHIFSQKKSQSQVKHKGNTQKSAISVQIPVYNAEKYLSECLDSIIQQTFTDFEVICVDDGSSDNSVAILKEYAKKDHRILVFQHESNKGTLQARKTAFEKAEGKYMVFVDADDIAKPNMLEELYTKAVGSNADLVQCGATIYDPEKKLTREVYDRYQSYFSEVQEYTAQGKDVFCAFDMKIKNNFWISIFRKNIYKKIIPYIPDAPILHGNDNLVMFMLIYFSQKYSSLDKILYMYRASDTSSNLTVPSVEKVKSHIRSRSEALFHAKEFMKKVELNWDENNVPFPRFSGSLFNYNVVLMERCLDKHPYARMEILQLLKGCFGKQAEVYFYENNIVLPVINASDDMVSSKQSKKKLNICNGSKTCSMDTLLAMAMMVFAKPMDCAVSDIFILGCATRILQDPSAFTDFYNRSNVIRRAYRQAATTCDSQHDHFISKLVTHKQIILD